MFAVANSALLNVMMASRLLYGMSKQAILPPFLSKVLPGRRTPWASIAFVAAVAICLVSYLSLNPGATLALLLGGTTSLLLLAVFAVVNAAVLVLRGQPADHEHSHFRTPTFLPVVGVVACLYLVLPWTSGRPTAQYAIAGGLLAVGVVLWGITWLHRRRSGYHLAAPAGVPDPAA
jgi:amino acid transporter